MIANNYVIVSQQKKKASTISMMTHKFAIFALSKVFIIFIRKSQCVWGALGQEKKL